MGNRRRAGEGTYRRTYAARVRADDGASRSVRIFRPAAESKAPTKTGQIDALGSMLRPGESLDVASIRESWQGRAVAPDGRRLTVYAPTRQEAAEKLADAMRAAASGAIKPDAHYC